ncbi:MAG: DUF4177 domain-containing protein [Lentisphaerae bacterium]|nr:DUF4177 domain-containing protein [Lentisphaerota bacterium]
MQQWEYTTLTLRIAPGQGKVPGFFNRSQTVRNIAEDSERDLNKLGAMGWELVNVLMLEYGAMDVGPTYACAILKRPADAASES